VIPGLTKQNKTKQNKTKQNKTKQSKTKCTITTNNRKEAASCVLRSNVSVQECVCV
jgi:hypothetical protein